MTTEEQRQRVEDLMHQLAPAMYTWRMAKGTIPPMVWDLDDNPEKELTNRERGALLRRENALDSLRDILLDWMAEEVDERYAKTYYIPQDNVLITGNGTYGLGG